MDTNRSPWSPRLLSGALLFRRLGSKELRGSRYLGTTGGDHIWRLADGRAWAVDLVTETAILCVGLPPSQWRFPPQDRR